MKYEINFSKSINYEFEILIQCIQRITLNILQGGTLHPFFILLCVLFLSFLLQVYSLSSR